MDDVTTHRGEIARNGKNCGDNWEVAPSSAVLGRESPAASDSAGKSISQMLGHACDGLDIEHWVVILNTPADGCLQARLFDSVAAARLNPIRFEWVPCRESRYKNLQIPLGADTSDVLTDSDTELEEPNFSPSG
ncbi:hypothetical protein PAXINDRAFT_102808 [Paxillus involutus ATCC 200175]|uniref:Uncharacterized protein n=1 Tax=Paxillus involutus ATCC 200175 TaxID=664439 RepID=A0A0C9TIK3_PAXIN|nr:hypothetical protein PAXINDRAFT_102808 [Paxillus involutus ATCC 200175]